MKGERDGQLRRVERGALVALGAIVAVGAAWGGAAAALGAAAGGLVVAVSYAATRAGVDALIAAAAGGEAPPRRTRSTVWRLVKFVTRFAILALIAYVMMVRLRAHPGWMLAGASSLPAAVAAEAVRALTRARP